MARAACSAGACSGFGARYIEATTLECWRARRWREWDRRILLSEVVQELARPDRVPQALAHEPRLEGCRLMRSGALSLCSVMSRLGASVALVFQSSRPPGPFRFKSTASSGRCARPWRVHSAVGMAESCDTASAMCGRQGLPAKCAELARSRVEEGDLGPLWAAPAGVRLVDEGAL